VSERLRDHQRERGELGRTAIKPVVQSTTGASDELYWRAIRVANERGKCE
jgi:hypothetical protein